MYSAYHTIKLSGSSSPAVAAFTSLLPAALFVANANVGTSGKSSVSSSLVALSVTSSVVGAKFGGDNEGTVTGTESVWMGIDQYKSKTKK